MRLFFVVHGYPPDQPGVWTYHHIQQLAARHEICVFVLATDPRRAHFEQWQSFDGNVLVWRLNNLRVDHLRGFSNPQIDAMFDYALQYFSPDVIHYEHVIGLSATLLARAKERSIPAVLALYDYYWVCPRVNLVRGDHSLCAGPSHEYDCVTCVESPEALGGVPWKLLLHDYRLNSMRALIEYPEVITACSNSLRDDITSMMGLAVGSVRTVSLGVPALAKSLEHTDAERVRIRYLGIIAPHKGIHVFAQAAMLLADLPVEFHLHGAVQAQYLEEVLAQGPSLIQHGAYGRDELPEILSQTDILVLPTLSRETFSFVIREATLAGVPVIASSFGSIPEFIHDGVNGLLVPPGDVDELAAALRRLTTDPSFRLRLVNNPAAIRSIESYSAEMERIYFDIAHHR